MPEELEGGRFYSAWWWVLLAVPPELEVELDVQLILDCEAGVSAPQSGENSAN